MVVVSEVGFWGDLPARGAVPGEVKTGLCCARGVGVTRHPLMGADHCLVVVRLRAIWLWLSLGGGSSGTVDLERRGLHLSA